MKPQLPQPIPPPPPIKYDGPITVVKGPLRVTALREPTEEEWEKILPGKPMKKVPSDSVVAWSILIACWLVTINAIWEIGRKLGFLP